MGSEDARLPHKAGISLLLAQTFSFETPQGSVQGLFLFLPLLSLLVNFTPFRGFKLHLYADGAHICISDSESTPTPRARPSFTNCLLPRVSGGCLKFNISKAELTPKPVCLLISSCFN